ncbi:DEAD/DEAH box helicase family protein, partial [Patescibacteria group bacterium]|nr:DEAD/DEAH box helicase family protein [Patescibacteria group bacterium]
CSDESVGRRAGDEIYHSVNEVSFPVTSDVTEIESFLNQQSNRVIFSTYHSSPLISEAQSLSKNSIFDLVIADEAHRCAGVSETYYAAALDNSKIVAHKRLFATATPRVFTAHVKSKAEDLVPQVKQLLQDGFFKEAKIDLDVISELQRRLLTRKKPLRASVVNVLRKMVRDGILERTEITRDKKILIVYKNS